MTDVKEALASINMPFDQWQGAFPYPDFLKDYEAGISPSESAAWANRHYWAEQDKVLEQAKKPGAPGSCPSFGR